MKTSILIPFFLIFSITLSAQDWVRVFGQNNYWTKFHFVKEDYDKGYIIKYGYARYNSTKEQAVLLKTDVNGYKLWEKTFGNGTDHYFWLNGLSKTLDGGMIICGSFSVYDSIKGDPFIMKLNACMQPEWCNVYHTPDFFDWAGDVIYLPWENAYILESFEYNVHNRFNVMKLDSAGNEIWKNVYANNPEFIGELPQNLLFYPYDSSYFYSGTVFAYEDSTGMYAEQPYWSKINKEGEFQWELFRIPDTTFTYGSSRKYPMFLYNGTILASTYGRSTPDHAMPRLTKIDKEGNFMDIYTLYKPDTILGAVLNSSAMYDQNTLLFGLQYYVTGFDGIGSGALQKTDTLGNLLLETILPADHTAIITDIMVTTDNKILLGSTHNYSAADFMVIKYNQNLEYDSLYTRPFTYDSLCPEGITSGTITMNCSLITGIKSHDNTRVPTITLTPNPADTYTVIYLPESIVTNQTQGIHYVTTYRGDYVKNLKMEVYDMNSRLIHSQAWPDNIKEQVLNTSGWNTGMYMIRIIKENRLISTGKLVVR